jgi:hypothetical protein
LTGIVVGMVGPPIGAAVVGVTGRGYVCGERGDGWVSLQLRAERRWGELLGEATRGGDTTAASNRLSDAEYAARHRARAVAGVDDGLFEAYCRERWGWTRQHANRTVAAADTARLLEPIGSIPASERVARELVPLRDEPERLREVWAGAVDEHGARPPVSPPSSSATLLRAEALARTAELVAEGQARGEIATAGRDPKMSEARTFTELGVDKRRVAEGHALAETGVIAQAQADAQERQTVSPRRRRWDAWRGVFGAAGWRPASCSSRRPARGTTLRRTVPRLSRRLSRGAPSTAKPRYPCGVSKLRD